MANIYFKCLCGKHLAVDESMAGRTVDCSECKKPVQIPKPELKRECFCGKTILAPASMVGEKVRCVECDLCVECNEILSIPQ